MVRREARDYLSANAGDYVYIPAGMPHLPGNRSQTEPCLTLHDSDPQLVFPSDGVVEYINEKKPLAVINFDDVSEIHLRVDGSSFSDSTIVRLDAWLDLHYLNGKKGKWRSSSFQGNLQVIQCFIETYSVHKALHRK